MYNVIVKVARLVCVTLIPLDDFASALGTSAFGMLVHALTLGILTFEMFILGKARG